MGNTGTHRNVILQKLLLHAGDFVDEGKLEESRFRLLGTGFFRTVEFSLRRGSRRGLARLRIAVTERNTFLVDDLYLGSSSVAPYFAGLGMTEHNFLGRGVSVGGGFVVGRDRRAFDLAVFAPDISSTPLQISASLLLAKGVELIDPDTTSSTFGYQRLGGTFGLGYSVAPAQRIALTYRVESVSADILPDLDSDVLKRAPQIIPGDSFISSLALSYERDTRDDPFVPAQGGRFTAAIEVATSVLRSDYEFSKYTAEFQHGFLFFGRHRFVLTAFGGFIQGRAPFFNQFFLNDFAYFVFGRNALPREAQVNFSESNDYDDLVMSLDANYNIPLIRGDDAIYAMYFFIGANVAGTASLEETQEDPTGRGAGDHSPLSFDAGIKLDTYMGNFTLSLAYSLDLLY
ncbi:MAG: BamA/TamA family outer membrane protein [Deltaproteobacteria bacterium]|nr:BamA/TamA family outer membrane protein [Deltaproteobacteria bacterium]